MGKSKYARQIVSRIFLLQVSCEIFTVDESNSELRCINTVFSGKLLCFTSKKSYTAIWNALLSTVVLISGILLFDTVFYH